MSTVFGSLTDTPFEPTSALGQVSCTPLKVLIDVYTPCHTSELISMWQILCGDDVILRKVFSHLLEVLNLSLPYQEKHKGNKIIRHCTQIPQTVSR